MKSPLLKFLASKLVLLTTFFAIFTGTNFDSKQFTRDLIEASKRDKMTGLYDKMKVK